MELDQRKVVILTTIIKNYLETGEPVGSRTISKYSGLNLSSATIRNEMSDLEEMGYIVQPHTSAGRIPSDKGYRFYVDQLMETHQHEIEDVKTEMFEKVDRLETTLKTLVKNLAENTNYAAVVTGPSIRTNKIKFIQTSLVDSRRLLLVIMMQGNIVKTATVMLDGSEELDFNRVLSINMLLNDELNGLSVEDITEGRLAQLLARTGYKETIKAIVASIVNVLDIKFGDSQIYTSGATNIFKYPELSESDNASKLISAFETKDELAALVKGSQEQGDGKKAIQVYIGDESPLQNMADCSVVTASYELGNGLKGTIGVIGPKRMDYEKVLEILSKIQNEMDQAFQ
ncbi:heat-inducible transcriptional repressor HrcA [Oribacterium sp. WCC10]|uniref:heat-inducible transcriptional repressor HrcA n=1 Tax=Oribacterium sp. WCC10 TaxID=1855343 RepID=UPI0008E4AFE6|nr:heat-inducible transcriptional repressor HrcA [Oribacterium sp. WCC10]SFG39065.1 heat-inducible transcription repressor HrcA [Oribacterium sp. WCC10]